MSKKRKETKERKERRKKRIKKKEGMMMTCSRGKWAPRMLSTSVSLAADRCATKYKAVTSLSFSVTATGAVSGRA